VLNDAISIYFADTTFASAFVADGAQRRGRDRWRRAQVREDETGRRGSTRGCIGHREGKRDQPDATLGAEPVFLVNDISEWWSLEQRSAVYHRTAAAKARRLRAEATTRWLKEQLEVAIAQHEQIAAEIERASEPDRDAASAEDQTATLSSETPGR
jgi:hypothetical protein